MLKTIMSLKEKLYAIIENDGIHSLEALDISRKIDKLITTYHKAVYPGAKTKDKMTKM